MGLYVADPAKDPLGCFSRQCERDQVNSFVLPVLSLVIRLVGLSVWPGWSTMLVMHQKVTLVGTGGMATVCAMLLDRQGYKVCLLARDAERARELIRVRENRKYLPGFPLSEAIEVTSDAGSAAKGACILVNCIPTQHIRSVWATIGEWVEACTPIASVAKGIEVDTLLRPTEVLLDALNERDKSNRRAVASISGPTIADELAKGLPASVVAASDDAEFAQLLQAVFNCDRFRVYTNSDLIGVELAGATKNVIALAAGILDGLDAGINAKSALLARGLAEIARLGVAMGARSETFFGVAGVGDLATTCFSPTGRNRSCGELLGSGLSLNEALDRSQGVVEGVPSTRSVYALAQRHGVEMPITRALHRVLFDGLNPVDGIQSLMARDPKPESLS